MSKIALSGNPSGTGTFTIASPNSNTDRTLTLPDAAGTVATQEFASNASNLSSGTVPAARLGSGTADSTTFLRGDGAWATIETTPTTDQVLTATAGASVGAVGTYAFLRTTSNTTISPGSTWAGSSLRYASEATNSMESTTTSPSGTWRAMGLAGSSSFMWATVFLRIS